MLNKETINKILLWVTAASVVTYAIGSLIINGFLSKYQIIDFELIKPHAIQVGIVFIFILIGHFLFFSLYTDAEETGNNNPLYIGGLTAIKVFLLSNLFFYLVEPETGFDDLYKLRIGNWTIPYSGKCFLMAFPLGCYIILFYHDFKEKKKKYLGWIYNVARVLFILTIFITHRTFKNHPTYTLIYNFEYTCGMFYFSYIFGSIIAYARINEKTEKSFKGSLFSRSEPSKKVLPYFLLFLILILGIGFYGVLRAYTTGVYGIIPQSYGGGKPLPIKFITDKDTVIGNKIYQTNEDVYIAINDSSLLKLNWSSINEITRKEKTK